MFRRIAVNSSALRSDLLGRTQPGLSAASHEEPRRGVRLRPECLEGSADRISGLIRGLVRVPSAAIRLGVASARVKLVPVFVLWTMAAGLVGSLRLTPVEG